MRITVQFAIVSFVALAAACAVGPSAPLRVEGKVDSVSQTDVNAAIAAFEDELAARHHIPMPVARVEVLGHDGIDIYCGDHYGNSLPPGFCHVQRIAGHWKVTEMVFQDPHVIVT